jgi:hypothetical protein
MDGVGGSGSCNGRCRRIWILTWWNLPNSGQVPLQQEMVRLVVESPLADGQGGSGVFHLQYDIQNENNFNVKNQFLHKKVTNFV